jgi:hypothetical protein
LLIWREIAVPAMIAAMADFRQWPIDCLLHGHNAAKTAALCPVFELAM